MSQIEIPIRVRFLKVPVRWDTREVESGERYVFPEIKGQTSSRGREMRSLDPWRCRAALLELEDRDDAGLVKFLRTTGIFLDGPEEILGHRSEAVWTHISGGNPRPISVAGLWRFRESLRSALIDEKAFKETYAPVLDTPETEYELVRDRGTDFALRLQLTNVAIGLITITDTYHALLASVFFDVARGLRFRCCAREGCNRVFPVGKQRSKKCCSWGCTHLNVVRKKRADLARLKLEKTACEPRA